MFKYSALTRMYALSLHDALPILLDGYPGGSSCGGVVMTKTITVDECKPPNFVCEDCIPSFSPLPGQKYILQIGEHTSELQSPCNLVCRLLLEKKKLFRASPIHCI